MENVYVDSKKDEEEKIELGFLEHQGCFYSLKELANKCSFNRSQIKNLVKTKEEYGIISVIPLCFLAYTQKH